MVGMSENAFGAWPDDEGEESEGECSQWSNSQWSSRGAWGNQKGWADGSWDARGAGKENQPWWAGEEDAEGDADSVVGSQLTWIKDEVARNNKNILGDVGNIPQPSRQAKGVFDAWQDQAQEYESNQNRKGIVITRRAWDLLVAVLTEHEREFKNRDRLMNTVISIWPICGLYQWLERHEENYRWLGEQQRKFDEDEHRPYSGNPEGKKPDRMFSLLLAGLCKLLNRHQEAITSKMHSTLEGKALDDVQEALNNIQEAGNDAKAGPQEAVKCFKVYTNFDVKGQQSEAQVTFQKWILNAPFHNAFTQACKTLAVYPILDEWGVSFGKDHAPFSKKLAKLINEKIESKQSQPRDGTGSGSKGRVKGKGKGKGKSKGKSKGKGPPSYPSSEDWQAGTYDRTVNGSSSSAPAGVVEVMKAEEETNPDESMYSDGDIPTADASKRVKLLKHINKQKREKEGLRVFFPKKHKS